MISLLVEIQNRAVAAGGEWVVVKTDLGLVSACHVLVTHKRVDAPATSLRLRWRLNGKTVTLPTLKRKLNAK